MRPEKMFKGIWMYSTAIVLKTIELSKTFQMLAVADVDAKEEIELYTAAGFERLEGQNSIAASYYV